MTWFDNYDRAALRADFISGLTVALVLVPQSMAYAQLAGLPAYYGLYAAFLPPMIASLFGSSRQLATGPVAVVSLMTSATLEPLATAGSEQFIVYALLLALMVGLFQLVLGILKLGVVVNFLSHPVVNGFTNAAALIIATSQLSKVFGVYVDKAPHHYETIYRVIVQAFDYTHWPTLGMAVISFGTMIVLRRVDRRIPNVLVAVVVTTFIAWATGFEQNEVVTIRQIGSDRVAEMARSFNKTVEMKEALETQRTASNKAWEQFEASGASLCTRCHDSREIRPPGPSPGAMEARTEAAEHALVLHGMARLVNRRIAELDHSISKLRTELRGMLFVRADSPDGQAEFYLREEVPEGVSVHKTTWRLHVGREAMSLDGLTMLGGGAVVAGIPQGIPEIRTPDIDWGIVPRLLAAAMIISLLGFMEAISIAKAMAARTRQKLDPNQELIGQGLANIVGCLSQSYPVSGSFSRSAVNLQAGGRTGLSNVFSSGVVLVVLLFLSGWLYHLPQAVLASIIMMAVAGLLNVSGFVHAWRTSRFDGMVSVVTFAGTLLLAPHLEWGIFAGVALSLGGYLYRTMRPQVVELAPHPDGTMRNASRHGLKTCCHIAVVSFEGPLNFASSNYLETEILQRVSELPQLNHLLIAGNGISEVDASGEETLRNVVDNLRDIGCEVSFSGISDKVLDVLRRSHLYARIGKEHFYGSRAQAIAAIYAWAHSETSETECPYLLIMPPVVELSLHEDGSLRNAERHRLRTCRHIAALRFDGPLDFANTAYIEQVILGRIADRPGLRHVVFVSHGITAIDDSGAKKLADLVERLKSDGYAVSFSGLKEEVVDVLEHNHVIDVLGADNLYSTQVTAIAGIYARAHTGSSEADCPLRGLVPRLTELSLHDSKTLRDADQHHLKLCRHIGLLRFGAPLGLFSQKAIQSDFICWAKTRPTVQIVIFVASRLGDLDGTEAENLLALVTAVREAGYRVGFTGFSDRGFETIARSGVADAIGLDNFYPSEAQAIADLSVVAHAEDSEEDCPLRGILPKLVELSLHHDGSLRNARRHGLSLCQRIVTVRFDGPLNFATFGCFERELRAALERRPAASHILFAGHALAGLDSIAAEQLPCLFEELRREGYKVVVSGLKDEELDLLHRTKGGATVGADAIFPTQFKAIASVYAEAHRESNEEKCPLTEVVYANS